MALTLSKATKVLADAAHVDLEIWMQGAISKLRDTETGKDFAKWAETNPSTFRNLLRGASAGVGHISSDSTPLHKAIYRALHGVPAELFNGFSSERRGGMGESFNRAFFEAYEDAIKGLSDEELALIARLSKAQLEEFVHSPKAIRPHLLMRWSGPGKFEEGVNKLTASVSDAVKAGQLEIETALTNELEKLGQKKESRTGLKKWIGKLTNT